MGIDPINKGGGAGPIAPGDLPASSGATAKETFEVKGAKAASEVSASSPLDRLRAGEIDINGYLDIRVEQATSHLVGKVDDEKLAVIRSSLRMQLETDPVLVDLVRRATEGFRQSTSNR